ncbi:MAG: hypothetical protein R2778_04820 [Saprospiraceae bacterium]
MQILLLFTTDQTTQRSGCLGIHDGGHDEHRAQIRWTGRHRGDIVGGVLPQYDLPFYTELFKKIKAHRPELHVKALHQLNTITSSKRPK